MNILYLGPERQNLIEFLRAYGDVQGRNDKLTELEFISGQYDWIISYGYRFIIPKKVITFYRNKIINLHISYLPWNRGADPNFWSFFYETPKGVTIHFIDEGIDTGDIIFQQIVDMKPNETLSSSYFKLSETIEKLFIDKWSKIINKDFQLIENLYRKTGSYHHSKEIALYKPLLTNGWNTSVKEIRSLKMNTIKVNDKLIGNSIEPFIIAEMSGNHNQSLERALEIVDAAAKSGVHALKIQTYTADTLTLDSDSEDFLVSDSESLWRNKKLYDLYKEAYTPWEWHKPIFKRAKELGMIAFSTPFDESSVDFLETLDVPLYKIASFENNDIPLIRKVARTGKPIIVSTGMASLADLELLVNTVKAEGNSNLILLKCTSTYPATPENTNIKTIPHLKSMFPNIHVGLSDHTMGIGVAVASVALGATVIEKHFTLSRADGGIDSAFSMEPDEMRSLVEETKRAWQSLGNVTYGATEREKASIKFRRSIYISSDMKTGDILTQENVRIVRPGFGLEPKYYDLILGKTIKHDVKRGTPLSWELLL